MTIFLCFPHQKPGFARTTNAADKITNQKSAKKVNKRLFLSILKSIVFLQQTFLKNNAPGKLDRISFYISPWMIKIENGKRR